MMVRAHLLLAYLVLAALLAVGLIGCATPEPRIVTKEVRTPVAVRCTPDVGPEPHYVSEFVAVESATIFDLAKALLIEREQRKVRALEMSAALEGCR